jgi:hypothetical protein
MGKFIKMYRNVIAFIGIILLFTGCSDTQGELVDKKPGSSSSSTVMTAKEPTIKPVSTKPVIHGNTAEVANLRFTIDSSWRLEQPKSAMRAAQFRLPSANSELADGELAIFTGIFGSPEANIQRWIGQFKKLTTQPDIEKKRVGLFNIQVLDVSGIMGNSMETMVSGSDNASESRMLAVVIDGHPLGPWYFKLIGPVDTLEHWKQTFDEMIDSLQPVE